jgi:ABC-type glycerol-3-phosphate transport system permease component
VLFSLDLLDSFAGLILPAVAPAFGVFLFRQAVLSSVPKELIEAARSDGCGEVRTFFRIVLPLVRPMTSAFLLITFLATWNNYLTPQIVMQSEGKFPLAVMIAQLKNVYYQDYGLLMAGTLFSIVPVAALFLFLQKDFVAGLTSGAVKG